MESVVWCIYVCRLVYLCFFRQKSLNNSVFSFGSNKSLNRSSDVQMRLEKKCHDGKMMRVSTVHGNAPLRRRTTLV